MMSSIFFDIVIFETSSFGLRVTGCGFEIGEFPIKRTRNTKPATRKSALALLEFFPLIVDQFQQHPIHLFRMNKGKLTVPEWPSAADKRILFFF